MRAKEQNTWAYRHIGVDWTCPVTDHRKWGKWGTGAATAAGKKQMVWVTNSLEEAQTTSRKISHAAEHTRDTLFTIHRGTLEQTVYSISCYVCSFRAHPRRV
jgi:hypothetical protein